MTTLFLYIFNFQERITDKSPWRMPTDLKSQTQIDHKRNEKSNQTFIIYSEQTKLFEKRNLGYKLSNYSRDWFWITEMLSIQIYTKICRYVYCRLHSCKITDSCLSERMDCKWFVFIKAVWEMRIFFIILEYFLRYFWDNFNNFPFKTGSSKDTWKSNYFS